MVREKIGLQTDGRTDGRTDGHGDNISVFFPMRKKALKKYPRSGLFFRSNISETVGDIRVLFALWPRAIIALPNGANDVSVVLIFSEI